MSKPRNPPTVPDTPEGIEAEAERLQRELRYPEKSPYYRALCAGYPKAVRRQAIRALHSILVLVAEKKRGRPYLYTGRITMGGKTYWGHVCLFEGVATTWKMVTPPYMGQDCHTQVFEFDPAVCDSKGRPFLGWVKTTVGKSVVTQALYRSEGCRNLRNYHEDPVRRWTRDQYRHRAPKRAQMDVVLMPNYELEQAIGLAGVREMKARKSSRRKKSGPSIADVPLTEQGLAGRANACYSGQTTGKRFAR